jgi:outer membrane protein OmpA-like peptidoglycan-associated protein
MHPTGHGKTTEAKPDTAKRDAAKPEAGHGAPAAATGPSVALQQSGQELVEVIKAELAQLSAEIAGPNAPAFSGTVVGTDARSVTLRQTFAQPIVVGYQALPYRPSCAHDPHTVILPYVSNVDPLAAQYTALVFFDFDRYMLTREAQSAIKAAAGVYKGGGSARIEVNGYTDLSGPADYDFRLSLRRADAVTSALMALGVDRSDIGVAAHGIADPRIPTPAGVREAQNRRVEIDTR